MIVPRNTLVHFAQWAEVFDVAVFVCSYHFEIIIHGFVSGSLNL